MAAGVGKARPQGPSGSAPAARSPRCSTIACTIRMVADHAQLVVQIVLTTSSNTVGLWTMRPAPAATHDRSGSADAAS